MGFDRDKKNRSAQTQSEPASADAPGKQARTDVQLEGEGKGGGGRDSGSIQSIAEAGVSGPSSSLPHADTIQQSFGKHQVMMVQAHMGMDAQEAAQTLGAEAYATGEKVAFKKSPDLHTAAHEAAHVVQQRGGVQLKGGVGQAGDQYEQHADQVADAVVAGRSAEGLLDRVAGGGASSGVQRKVVQMEGGDTTGTDSAGGDSAGGDAAAGGEGDAEGGEDGWEDFKTAIASYNESEAETTWSKLNQKDKAKLGSDGDAQVKLMHTLHKKSVKMLKEGGVTWSDHVANLTVFLMPDFDDWYDELWAHGMYQSFREAYPVRNQMPDTAAKKIQGWMNIVAGDVGAQLLFEKVYPKLNSTPRDEWEKVAVWAKDKVGRLYNILASQLPVGHVQTITGGFTLIDKIKEWDDTTSAYVWNTLNFAWWEPDAFRCVLNNSSSGADGGDTTHGMTGGSGSGASSAYTGPDGNPGTNTSSTHFNTSGLHEVGHGVGQRMGGDDFAMSAAFPSWTLDDPSAWGDAQWDAGATSGSDPGGLHEDASLDEDDAKAFMLSEIKDGSGSWSSWLNDAPRADIVAYIDAVYANQPLHAQWDKVVRQDDGDNAYGTPQVRGDWTYAYLSRWDSPFTAKYKSQAHNQKVSWYSLSSPKEWFAEQYAHYYRTEKDGGGLLDGATKTFLDNLDSQSFHPTNDEGTEGVVVGGSSGGSSAGGASAGAGGSAGGAGGADEGPQQRKPPEGSRPSMFPW